MHLILTKQCLGFWVIKKILIGPTGLQDPNPIEASLTRPEWERKKHKGKHKRGGDNTLKINAGEIQSKANRIEGHGSMTWH